MPACMHARIVIRVYYVFVHVMIGDEGLVLHCLDSCNICTVTLLTFKFLSVLLEFDVSQINHIIAFMNILVTWWW